METVDIIVTVVGGVIQHVTNIPPGVRVLVRDYDVQGSDVFDDKGNYRLPVDEQGHPYAEGVYEQTGE